MRLLRKDILRYVLLVALLVAAALQASAETPAQRFARSSAINADKASVVILDLSSGEITDSLNADLPLIPASINKTLTIASLLEETGIDYRYPTDVYAGGNIRDGVLEGNLVVVGGGDPTLGANVEPVGTDIIEEIVSALRDKKVTSIAGSVVIDSDIFPGPCTPPSWHPSDLRQAYGTGCHGFNWRRNASGNAAVDNPQRVFASALTSALRNAGISVQGGDYPQNKRKGRLLRHLSPPVDEIMRSCMMRSDNLYAEALLRTLALVSGKDATPENGARLELDHWKKKHLPMEGVTVVDGSGLSRSDRLTARFLAEMLRKMAGNADYASFFPLAGQEGTLRNFMKGTALDGYLALKTGSMNGIQCYAGYLLDDDYAPTHAIVVMINAFPISRGAARQAVADMFLSSFVNNN